MVQHSGRRSYSVAYFISFLKVRNVTRLKKKELPSFFPLVSCKRLSQECTILLTEFIDSTARNIMYRNVCATKFNFNLDKCCRIDRFRDTGMGGRRNYSTFKRGRSSLGLVAFAIIRVYTRSVERTGTLFCWGKQEWQ